MYGTSYERRVLSAWGTEMSFSTFSTIAQDLAGQHGPLMDHYCPKVRPQTTKTIALIKNHYLGGP